MNFKPVSTLPDLDSLSDEEIVQGYLDFRPGDPEPGPNRGRAYWHGWMNGARDHRGAPHTIESTMLCKAYVARGRFP